MWKEWPRYDSMPSIPGSFGRLSGPFDITTKRAVMRSPRLVCSTQRRASSSHSMWVTSVWKQALEYRSYFLPIASACWRISGAKLYFSLGT